MHMCLKKKKKVSEQIDLIFTLKNRKYNDYQHRLILQCPKSLTSNFSLFWMINNGEVHVLMQRGRKGFDKLCSSILSILI